MYYLFHVLWALVPVAALVLVYLGLTIIMETYRRWKEREENDV